MFIAFTINQTMVGCVPSSMGRVAQCQVTDAVGLRTGSCTETILLLAPQELQRAHISIPGMTLCTAV